MRARVEKRSVLGWNKLSHHCKRVIIYGDMGLGHCDGGPKIQQRGITLKAPSKVFILLSKVENF